ncbi:hypothetical protein SNEBB_003062 [Seison nebaliae]|nr:hypothetical protein SNEBB_003062 [Seison nebaliae]
MVPHYTKLRIKEKERRKKICFSLFIFYSALCFVCCSSIGICFQFFNKTQLVYDNLIRAQSRYVNKRLNDWRLINIACHSESRFTFTQRLLSEYEKNLSSIEKFVLDELRDDDRRYFSFNLLRSVSRLRTYFERCTYNKSACDVQRSKDVNAFLSYNMCKMNTSAKYNILPTILYNELRRYFRDPKRFRRHNALKTEYRSLIQKVDVTSSQFVKTNDFDWGIGRPKNCFSPTKVAVIIPYRNRNNQLKKLLFRLHYILSLHKINYVIYVCEQTSKHEFNKGIVMNAGFLEIWKYEHENDLQLSDCFIFHDVDMIALDDRLVYNCSYQPKHLAVEVDTLGMKLVYKELIGGVLVVPAIHFLYANGFSNLYWAWGAEDDDFFYRLDENNLNIERSSSYAQYHMLIHQKRKAPLGDYNLKLLQTDRERLEWDGLSSVRYRLVARNNQKLYTQLLIEVSAKPYDTL